MAAGRCFMRGAFDISATVKAYFALKMIGDDPDAPHMKRAREAILAPAAPTRPTSSPASCWRFMANARGTNMPTVPVELILSAALVPDPSFQDVAIGRAR